MGDIDCHCSFLAVKFCQAVSKHASKRLKTFEKLGLVDILPKPTKSKRKFRICLKNCLPI